MEHACPITAESCVQLESMVIKVFVDVTIGGRPICCWIPPLRRIWVLRSYVCWNIGAREEPDLDAFTIPPVGI